MNFKTILVPAGYIPGRILSYKPPAGQNCPWCCLFGNCRWICCSGKWILQVCGICQ